MLLLLAAFVEAAPLDVHREALPNGMVILVAERPAIPIVVVRAYVRAGSAFDPPGRPGLANLTGELLTRGTARRSGPQLDAAIEFVGGSLGADAGRDGVTISLSVLKKDLALGFDLLTEVLSTPSFPQKELEQKRKEIRAAIRRSEDDPEAVAGRALAEALYPGHPYGHPVSGTEASVGQLTREHAVGFYRRHYRPDATIVAVVGDVKHADVLRELTARLSRWRNPRERAPSPSSAPAVPPVQARAVPRDLTQATVYLGRPAVRQDHPDYYPLLVASYVLGGGSTSRLYTKVREEAGLAYSVGSHVSASRYGAAFLVSLQTRAEGVAEALRLVTQELARMTKEAVSDQELALAKAYLTGSFPLRMDTSSELAGLLVAVEEYGLGLDYPDRFKARVGAITAADVLRVAGTYLDPATFSRVTVGRADLAPKTR
jgi:zinc protease